VIYQVYPRSFADSDGDGIGDLPGHHRPAAVPVRPRGGRRLAVARLPLADGGRRLRRRRLPGGGPAVRQLEDADLLIAEAHRLGLRVVLDLVPNHTSDEHAWFRARWPPRPAARSGRATCSGRRGESGELPPNTWRSVFGGPAWTRVTEPDGTPGQWYLHLFDDKQPDLDWTHPQVRAEFEDILRFWLDRGVDGFRVDVAHGLVKADGLPDWDHEQELLDGSSHGGERPPMWDQDGVHDIYRSWRRVLDEYDGDRMLVAEAWVEPAERLARYVRPDEMHQAFNFAFLSAGWRAADLRASISDSLEASATVGAPATWVLSNHDVVRHTTRLTLPLDAPAPERHRRAGTRSRRAARAPARAGRLAGHARPAGLGVPLPGRGARAARAHDPAGRRAPGPLVVPPRRHRPRPGRLPGAAALARRPARLRLRTDRCQLAAPAGVLRAVRRRRQAGDPGSTLELYRRALRLRAALGLGPVSWCPGRTRTTPVLSFRLRAAPGEVIVTTNFGGQPAALPSGAEVLLSSAPLDDAGRLPVDATAWLAG
jgi:alpha-glucosidase